MKVRKWLEKIPESVGLVLAMLIGYKFDFNMTYLVMEYWLGKIDNQWIVTDGVDECSVACAGDYLELIDDSCFKVWQVRELIEDYVFWLKLGYEHWAIRINRSLTECINRELDTVNMVEGPEEMSDEFIKKVLGKIDREHRLLIEQFIVDRNDCGSDITYNTTTELIEDYVFYLRMEFRINEMCRKSKESKESK